MTKYYSTLFNLLALSAVLYVGVGVFYRVVQIKFARVSTDTVVMQKAPDIKEEKKASLEDFQVVADRNLFGSLEKPPEPEKEEELKTEELEALEPTSLKILLLGTVSGSDEDAYAVIEETAKRKQGLYRVGDSIQEAIVRRILRGKVILRVGEKDEILTMEEAAAYGDGRKQAASRVPGVRGGSEGERIEVSRAELQDSLKNINRLLSQVRIRPHFRDGRADGLAVSRIKPDSVFTRLGLEDGDIIKEVNGQPIKSPDDILGLYRRLKSGSQVSLQVDRRGESKALNYSFQ